jgi:hypothetical protein
MPFSLNGVCPAGWLAHRPPDEVRTLEAVLRRLSQGRQSTLFWVGRSSVRTVSSSAHR